MNRLYEFLKKRHQIAQRYDKAFKGFLITLPWQHPDSWSSYHLYPISIKQNESNTTQRQVHDAMQMENINVNLHYIPVYRQSNYEVMGFNAGYCPDAEQYFQEALSIPIYPTLTESEQAKVIRVVSEIIA